MQDFKPWIQVRFLSWEQQMLWHQLKVKKNACYNLGICPALSSCNNTQDICRHISKTVYNKNISTKQYFSYRKNSKEKTDFIVKIWAHPRQVTGQIFLHGKVTEFYYAELKRNNNRIQIILGESLSCNNTICKGRAFWGEWSLNDHKVFWRKWKNAQKMCFTIFVECFPGFFLSLS